MHKKINTLYQLGAEKIEFPPKSDGHADMKTNRKKLTIQIEDLILIHKLGGLIQMD